MKIWMMAAVLICAGMAAQAGDARLDAAGITAALTDQSLSYDDGSKQLFKADGDTIYDNGKPSTGRWTIRGGRYCSQWPPSDSWACYDVTESADGQVISFVADDGTTSAGHPVK